MHFQEEFYQARTNSRATSLPEVEIRVSEMDSNGVLISKPLKKVEYISEPTPKSEPETEAQLWNHSRNGPVLESKADSVNSINKMKVIHDFITFHN